MPKIAATADVPPSRLITEETSMLVSMSRILGAPNFHVEAHLTTPLRQPLCEGRRAIRPHRGAPRSNRNQGRRDLSEGRNPSRHRRDAALDDRHRRRAVHRLRRPVHGHDQCAQAWRCTGVSCRAAAGDHQHPLARTGAARRTDTVSVSPPTKPAPSGLFFVQRQGDSRIIRRAAAPRSPVWRCSLSAFPPQRGRAHRAGPARGAAG